MEITLKELIDKGACDLDKFKKLFGDQVKVTQKNCLLAIKNELDLGWAAENFFAAAAWEVYNKATAPAGFFDANKKEKRNQKLKRRKWCYCQKPSVYGIHCDLCGEGNITWSEYEHLIWCFHCSKDTPGTGGIFDGPIPLEVSKILGISFDRIEISSGRLLKMKHTKTGKLYWRKERNGTFNSDLV